MLIIDNETYICIYKIIGTKEFRKIESGNLDFIKGKLNELTTVGRKIEYKILVIVSKGIGLPNEIIK